MTQPYHPYVFKDGRFVGEFEAMYRDGEANSFDAWHQDDLAGHPVLKALDGVVANTVLDLGCGKGALTDAIRKLTGSTCLRAIDCSATAISIARKRYSDINFQVGSISHVITRWGTHDLIVASEVLSYVEGWRNVVADMMRFGRAVCIGLYLPQKPLGHVPSHRALIHEIEAHGKITKVVDGGPDRSVYLAHSIRG